MRIFVDAAYNRCGPGGTLLKVRHRREDALMFEIEGHQVACWGSAGERLWHCTCDDFERRLTKCGEGFCAHTAVVMMRHSMQGDEMQIDQ